MSEMAREFPHVTMVAGELWVNDDPDHLRCVARTKKGHRCHGQALVSGCWVQFVSAAGLLWACLVDDDRDRDLMLAQRCYGPRWGHYEASGVDDAVLPSWRRFDHVRDAYLITPIPSTWTPL